MSRIFLVLALVGTVLLNPSSCDTPPAVTTPSLHRRNRSGAVLQEEPAEQDRVSFHEWNFDDMTPPVVVIREISEAHGGRAVYASLPDNGGDEIPSNNDTVSPRVWWWKKILTTGTTAWFFFNPNLLFTGISFVLLIGWLYWDLTSTVPTSGNLAKDFQQPIPMCMKMIGTIVESLCPWTAFDLSEPRALMHAAAKETGLDPIFDPHVITSLEHLCDSIRNNEVRFHFFGRWIMHVTIVSGLAQYLQLEDIFRRNPDLEKTALNQPIFVAGLPRSGTTHLHRVLSMAPNGYSPPLWEHFYPVPTTNGFFGLDIRKYLFKFQFLAWKFLARKYGIESIHFVDPDEPDECNFSLRVGGASHLYWVMSPVEDYITWLTSGDEESTNCLMHSYKVYRKVLQVWQSQNPDKRLVLKSPSHALHLKKMIAAIPEARIILTHRGSSTDLIASELSLFSRLHKTLTDGFNLQRSFELTAEKTFKYSHNMVDFVKEFSERHIFHSSYETLISSDPHSLVAEIHKFFGIAMPPEFEDILSHYLGRNTQHARGKHVYSLKDTGFTEEFILKEGLGRYREHFSQYLGGK